MFTWPIEDKDVFRITAYKLETPSDNLAVTLNEFKEHLDISTLNTDDDTNINAALKAAILYCQNYTNLYFLTSTVKAYANDFYDTFLIFKGPVTSITSIKYYDANNSLQTLDASNYNVSLDSAICTIEFDQYPTVYDRVNSVVVQMECGYGDTSADVPEDLQTAIKLVATNNYEYREDNSIRGTGAGVTMIRVSKQLMDNHKIINL